MDVFILYLYIVAALAAFFGIKSYVVIALKSLLYPSGRVHNFISKHILLPHLFRRRRLWEPMTRLWAILHVIHFAGTIACNIIGVHDLTAARSRAGSLATLHIASLAIFPRLSFGAAFLNMSLPIHRQLHVSLGIMGVLQSLLHVILALQVTLFDLKVAFQRYGFAVSSRETNAITTMF